MLDRFPSTRHAISNCNALHSASPTALQGSEPGTGSQRETGQGAGLRTGLDMKKQEFTFSIYLQST